MFPGRGKHDIRAPVDFLRLVEHRYSVRSYKADVIADELLNQVLSAALLAPTACNRQPFRFLVLPTHGNENRLLRIYGRTWFVEAPYVIGVAAVLPEAWSRRDGVNYAIVDATIAMDHLILAATELGLGTCWVAAFDPKVARAELRLPDDVEPVAFSPLGYAADQQPPKMRKSLNELVRYGHW